jgi:uncharacterized membrane protein
MESMVYNFFNDDEFLRISNKIKQMEKSTSGEIRISIKEKRNFTDRNKSIRELSEKEFHRLGMHATRDKTGILLYLLLREKQFYILADAGIDSIVGQETWIKVSDEMQQKFKEGKFSEGIIWGIGRVGSILSEHFPIKAGDANELSNKVVLES